MAADNRSGCPSEQFFWVIAGYTTTLEGTISLDVDRFDIPSPEAYKKALTSIKEAGIPKNHLKMLEVHFHSRKSTTTVDELAEAVAYKGFEGVNSQYGRFAARLCDEFGLQLKTCLSALATWEKGSNDVLKMRHQVAIALKELGWF